LACRCPGGRGEPEPKAQRRQGRAGGCPAASLTRRQPPGRHATGVPGHPAREIPHQLFVSFGSALSGPCSRNARTRSQHFTFYFLQIGIHRPHHPCDDHSEDPTHGGRYPASTRNALKCGRAPALSPQRRSSVTALLATAADSLDPRGCREDAAASAMPATRPCPCDRQAGQLRSLSHEPILTFDRQAIT
jgi:hypothetical protein